MIEYGVTLGEYWGFLKDYIGIMENNMETTVVYWGFMGMMENKKGNYYNGLYRMSVTYTDSR